MAPVDRLRPSLFARLRLEHDRMRLNRAGRPHSRPLRRQRKPGSPADRTLSRETDCCARWHLAAGCREAHRRYDESDEGGSGQGDKAKAAADAARKASATASFISRLDGEQAPVRHCVAGVDSKVEDRILKLIDVSQGWP
jgi:hypothetical protein